MSVQAAEKLYNMGVIDVEEYSRRLILIRSLPKQREDVPRFVKIDGGVGDEKSLLKKIAGFPLPKFRIGIVNVKIRMSRGMFSARYRDNATRREFSYPGRFATREHAQIGVRYLVWAINKEIERRNKKALSAN
jgi:hypothetical protein